MPDPLADIEKTLLEDRKEGVRHDEIVAGDAAIATCKHIAFQIAPWLTTPPAGFKWTVFGSDDGGVELVCHSKVSKRQITFQIANNGYSVNCHSIDEDMRLWSEPMPLGAEPLREKLEWVAPFKTVPHQLPSQAP